MKPVERLRLVVAGTIVVAWIASLIVDVLVPEYDTPATLNTLALMVAGFLFAPTLIKSRNGDSQ